MTDSHTGYLVTLEFPKREDHLESTLSALRQIKGVIDVRPIVAGMDQMSGAVRMDTQWRNALFELAQSGPEQPTS